MKLLPLLLLLPTLSIQAADVPSMELKQEAMSVIKPFAKELKSTMQTAMKAGGPMQAIELCNTEAAPIAKKASERSGWNLKRTSLKTRNTDNAPDQWETEVLNYFAEQKSQGADPKTLVASTVQDINGVKTQRFMKAIPTGDVCLKCHGAKVDDKVLGKINDLYSQDTAIGYSKGDIRGAFSLSKAQ